MSQIEPRAVQWLWPRRLPLGRISMLVGRPGEGKSFLTADIAARVAAGRDWPDGSPCPQGSVIMLSGEDDPHDTIRPRLDAHGFDKDRDGDRIAVLKASYITDETGKRTEHPINLSDIDNVRGALDRMPDCKLLIVDPIGTYMGGKTDTYRDNEVRAILTPLATLAQERGVAVLVVAHRRKSAGSNADEMAMGSRAFTGIARAVWHLSRDADHKDRRLLLPGKSNLAARSTGLAFTIGGNPACLSWEPKAIDMTADEKMCEELKAERSAGNQKRGPEPFAVTAAKNFLEQELSDGPLPVKELKSRAAAAGESWASVTRAKADIGIQPVKRSDGWWWSLPKARSEAPEYQGAQVSGNLSILRTLGSEPLREDSVSNLSTLESQDAQDAQDAQVSEELEHLAPEADPWHEMNDDQAPSPAEPRLDHTGHGYSASFLDFLDHLASALDAGTILHLDPSDPTSRPRIRHNDERLLRGLREHWSQLKRFWEGDGLPDPSAGTDAGDLLWERMALMEADDIDTTTGSPGWIRAHTEALRAFPTS